MVDQTDGSLAGSRAAPTAERKAECWGAHWAELMGAKTVAASVADLVSWSAAHWVVSLACTMAAALAACLAELRVAPKVD